MIFDLKILVNICFLYNELIHWIMDEIVVTEANIIVKK